MVTITEEDLQKLNQRVFQQKMDELFEEPSTYEDEEDEQYNFHSNDYLWYCRIVYYMGT